jgi:hypothetical protein
VNALRFLFGSAQLAETPQGNSGADARQAGMEQFCVQRQAVGPNYVGEARP